jgi:hypothetical protein
MPCNVTNRASRESRLPVALASGLVRVAIRTGRSLPPRHE